MYSRIERGDRKAKREQVIQLSASLNVEREELLSLWIADKICTIIGEDKTLVDKALKLVYNSNIWR